MKSLLSLSVSIMFALLAGCSGEMTVGTDNLPPSVDIYTPSAIQTGDVVIEFDLFDAESTPCTINVNYKGGSCTAWVTATITGQTAYLEPGEDLKITWHSQTDQFNISSTDYRIRIIPNDGLTDGAAAKTGTFSVQNNTNGTVLWTFVGGNYIASPPALSIETGRLFIQCGMEKMYISDLDGILLGDSSSGSAAPCYPAVDEAGWVYNAFPDLKSIRAENTNGQVQWNIQPSMKQSAPGVSIADGRIIYACFEDKSFALDYRDGSILHQNSSGSTDGLICINSSGTTLYAVYNHVLTQLAPDLSPANWTWPLDGPVRKSPVLGNDGTLYVATNFSIYSFDSQAQTINWSITPGCEFYSSPVIGADGTLYIGTSAWRLLSVDPSDGSYDYLYLAGYEIHGSPAAAADGTIIFGCGDNNIYAIHPDGTLKWKVETGGKVNSSPIIGPDGTIYIGSDDRRLYAISDHNGGPADSGWPMIYADERNTCQAQ